MDGLILIRNIQVSGANAISGFTWGFPAITHFLGFTHALQRKLPKSFPIKFLGCGVICHQHQVHAHKASVNSDYVFALSRNPLNKSGGSAAFVEEGKMNMEVSLLIPYEDSIGLNDEESLALADALLALVFSQKLAGGMITNQPRVQIVSEGYLQKNTGSVLRSLLPGFALIGRHEYLEHEQERLAQQGEENAGLKAWLSFSALRYTAEQPESEESKVQWRLEKKPYPGWLKPIMVGYRPLAPLQEAGSVAKARDSETPVCFVENLYSLGEWISPHRFEHVDQLIWQQRITEDGLYLCSNSN